MRIQVCLTVPGACQVRDLDVPDDCSVAQAVRASGLVANDWAGEVGLYGMRVDTAHRLSAGDRVELYHALPVDPRTRRRVRAARRGPSGALQEPED